MYDSAYSSSLDAHMETVILPLPKTAVPFQHVILGFKMQVLKVREIILL